MHSRGLTVKCGTRQRWLYAVWFLQRDQIAGTCQESGGKDLWAQNSAAEIEIDDMQLGFMKGKGTTDATVIPMLKYKSISRAVWLSTPSERLCSTEDVISLCDITHQHNLLKRDATIRDAFLTCSQKLTWVRLIYCTEPTTNKWKKKQKNKKKGYDGNDLQKR